MAKPGAADDREFWNAVGRDFPDLGGTASTRSYREDEIRLLREHLPAFPGQSRYLPTKRSRRDHVLGWM